jgi:hypothetical protein
VTDARKGTVSIVDSTKGKFTYMPDMRVLGGTDTFTYQVISGDVITQHTVAIMIEPRIMTLGGAITAGVTDASKQLPKPALRVGYRQPLQVLLAANGYRVDFVGSQSFGHDIQGFDPDNEARPGWSAAEIAYGKKGTGADGIYGWLDRHPADIVLLQLSVNQLAGGLAGIEGILNEIDRWEMSAGGNPVTVVLLGVLTRGPGTPAINAFNRGIKVIVARRVSHPGNSPDDIVVIDDPNALLSPADFHDQLSPNSTGYRKLAQLWRAALVDHDLLNKCP